MALNAGDAMGRRPRDKDPAGQAVGTAADSDTPTESATLSRLFLKLKYLTLCCQLMEQANRVKHQEIVTMIGSVRLSHSPGLLSAASINSGMRRLQEMARQVEVLPEVLVRSAFLLYCRIFWSDSETGPQGEISSRAFNMSDTVCQHILSRMREKPVEDNLIVRRYQELHTWMLTVTDTAIAHNVRNTAFGATALIPSMEDEEARSCVYCRFHRNLASGQEWRDTYSSIDLFLYMMSGCRKLLEDKLSHIAVSPGSSQDNCHGNMHVPELLHIPECEQLTDEDINGGLAEIPSIYLPDGTNKLFVFQLAADDKRGDIILATASLFDILSDLSETWRLLHMYRTADRGSYESYALLAMILNTYRRCFASGRYGSSSIPGFKGGFLTPDLVGMNQAEKNAHNFIVELRNKAVRHQLDEFSLNNTQLLQDIEAFLRPNSRLPVIVNMIPPVDTGKLENILAVMVRKVYSSVLSLFQRTTSSEQFQEEVRRVTPEVIERRGLKDLEEFRRTASSVDPYAFILESHDRGDMARDWPSVPGTERLSDPRSLLPRRSEVLQGLSEDDDENLGLPF